MLVCPSSITLDLNQRGERHKSITYIYFSFLLLLNYKMNGNSPSRILILIECMYRRSLYKKPSRHKVQEDKDDAQRQPRILKRNKVANNLRVLKDPLVILTRLSLLFRGELGEPQDLSNLKRAKRTQSVALVIKLKYTRNHDKTRQYLLLRHSCQ